MHEIWGFHSRDAEDSSDTMLLRGQLFPQQSCWWFKWYCVVERAFVSTAVLLKIQVILCHWEGSCFHISVAEDSSDTVSLRGQLFPQQSCWRFKWYCVVERAVVSTAVLLKIQVILCCWEGSSKISKDHSAFAFSFKQPKQNRFADKAGVIQAWWRGWPTATHGGKPTIFYHPPQKCFDLHYHLEGDHLKYERRHWGWQVYKRIHHT